MIDFSNTKVLKMKVPCIIIGQSYLIWFKVKYVSMFITVGGEYLEKEDVSFAPIPTTQNYLKFNY